MIRYAWAETDLGRFLLGASDHGICFLALDAAGALRRLAEWTRRHEPSSPAPVEDGAALREAADQVARYARGRLKTFDVPLDLRGTEFQRSVWRAEREIPFGETRTYAEVARRVGRPRATRAVGGATGRNPVPILVPCHRVVASDGLGGFSCGVHHKIELLRHEGAGIPA